MRPGDETCYRLLTTAVFVLVVAGLKASFAVTMPLAVAAVIVAACWPLKPWLDEWFPSTLSYIGTVLILLLLAAGFVGAIYISAVEIAEAFIEKQERINELYQSLIDWSERWGVQAPSYQFGQPRLMSLGQSLLANSYTLLAYLGFIGLLVVLGLLEVAGLRAKLQHELSRDDRRETLKAIEAIALNVRQYLGVTFLTSLITGVGSAAWAFAVGLELALVWGVLNFLLNFVPVVGNIIGIVPPTLYAAVQFQDVTMTLLVFFGFAVLQIAISNFVYPAMQGRVLSLSPVVVVIALAFWSWLWGIAGALIAVPLTAAIIIVCKHFPRARWVANLLSTSRNEQ